ncbi:GlsB/YeaQ/YmgE family stress response membrane protein [Nakamurella sp. A5-74]|uniref:GlsB/YeaQ/YmgE family stress response membrane protein n=1 Tax=Nakamurella sp. A5-74 TaxID=3158264 RepID=A0AAU8DP57_9ACTN
MIGFIIMLIVIGLIAGAIGRLVVKGTGGMSIPLTILLGIIGSFVGGFLGRLFFGADSKDGWFQASGIIGSIIGAIIVVFLFVRFSGKKSIS